MSKKPSAIIVGAGPGGLSAAMLLAHRGFDVQIFEKADRVGGRNAKLSLGKYHFDIGPTFLMMKFILDQVFMETGRRVEDYIDCVKLSPMYDLRFSDSQITVYSEQEKMYEELKRAFPGQEKGLEKFMRVEQERFQRMLPCLQMEYSSWVRMFSRNLRRALPILSLGRSLYDVMGDYFTDERAKLSFTFQSKYLGMSPWECPGAFAIIPYVEHAYGIYHVQGGLSQISEAMAKVCQEEGAHVHLSSPVKKVLVKGGKAVGVELESGKKHYADAVIMNADFGFAATQLLPKNTTKYTEKKLRGMKWSCSTFMLYLGLDKKYDLDHHTIVFAEDYKKNIKQVFDGALSGENISFYVRNSVVTDSSDAPKGHSSLYVLVPVPNQLSDIDWDAQKHAQEDIVLTQIEKRLGLKDLRKHIVAKHVITPNEWNTDFNVFLGATFNLAHNIGQMLSLRPHNKSSEVEGLYWVGGGTHPGSGLPTIYESGRIAANILSHEKGIAFHTYNVQV